MKKLYSVLLLLCIATISKAQVINFADANFKTKLLQANESNTIAKNLAGDYFKIDVNLNGEIEVTEAAQVSYLDISNSTLQTIVEISNFSSLQYLDCSNSGSVNHNQLTSLNLSGLANLQTINSSQNYNLSSLNLTGCISLRSLNCRTNNLGTLNVSSFSNLQSLDCAGSYLTSLNVTGLTNLTTLNCCCNLLTTLNLASCTNLNVVICDNNNLTSLVVNGLSQLQTLNLYNNHVTELNLAGCMNLTELICWHNQITNLDLSGRTNLLNLECWQNSLTNINLSGCINLQTVNCRENNLASLDLSGLTNLQEFNCRINNLATVNLNGLTTVNFLDFSFNQLTELDVSICPLLSGIYLNDNNLNFLNLKNGNALLGFSLYNNPNLSYICCDDSQRALVNSALGPNSVNINSYCSFVPGGTYYTIQGETKIDSDMNGCTATDLPFTDLNILVTDGTNTENIIANDNNNYYIPVQAGDYTITPILENPNYFTIFPTNVLVTFPTDESPLTQNFCVTPNGSHQDVETWIVPLTPARPGFDSRYKIKYKNKGTIPVSGSITFAFDDDYMDFISALPTINSQSFSSLTWDYANLLPYQTREIEVTFNINSPTETPPVNIGDVIKFSSTINPFTGDEYTSDNFNRLQQTVVGSIDPNDKVCVEGNTVEPDIVGKYVHYIIRFENTGTFAAENIVVKDIVDTDKFDMTTLVPLEGSHDFVTRITNSNQVEFIFENINLPFDDAHNDGYVAFKIKTKPSLVVGDSFSNTASIYFDYNFPIDTNLFTTTIQQLSNTDFDFSTYFNLYPNPANNLLNIKPMVDISMHSVSIYNILGQMIQVDTNPNEMIDISGLKAGNYFISITTDKGKVFGRFVKN